MISHSILLVISSFRASLDSLVILATSSFQVMPEPNNSFKKNWAALCEVSFLFGPSFLTVTFPKLRLNWKTSCLSSGSYLRTAPGESIPFKMVTFYLSMFKIPDGVVFPRACFLIIKSSSPMAASSPLSIFFSCSLVKRDSSVVPGFQLS